MTTERGPVGPGTAELRERLAETYYRLRWADGSWSWLAPQHKAPYYELVDALLSEIAAAGLSIVATDRLERIEAFASAAATVERHVEDVFSRDVVLPHHVEELNRRTSHVHTLRREAFAGLQPGDVEMIPLEPLAGGNER